MERDLDGALAAMTVALGPDLSVTEKGGVYHLLGVLNENAELGPLLTIQAPLALNFRGVTRFNSVGIRNMLRFLQQWGQKPLRYIDCPTELINQISMIPSLLGLPKPIAEVQTLFVPYECTSCDHEEEVLAALTDYAGVASGGDAPSRPCPKCGQSMEVASDTFFAFLDG